MNKKNILLLGIVLMSSFFIQSNAQNLIATGKLATDAGSNMTGSHILYVKLTPDNVDGTYQNDCSFILTEGDFAGWSSASIVIRLSEDSSPSVDDGVLPQDSLKIDFFNGVIGWYARGETYFWWEFDKSYEFWIETSVPDVTYSVYVKTPEMTEPALAASNFTYREQDVEALDTWSTLNGLEIGNGLLAEGLGYVDAVGTIPTISDAIKSFNSDDVNIYPNPTQGTLNIQNPYSGEFSYEIYSITGKLVANRKNITGSVSTVNMDNYAKGIYIINVKSAERFETHKFVLK